MIAAFGLSAAPALAGGGPAASHAAQAVKPLTCANTAGTGATPAGCSGPVLCYGSGCTGLSAVTERCTNYESLLMQGPAGTDSNGNQLYIAQYWSSYCGANWTVLWTTGKSVALTAYVAYSTAWNPIWAQAVQTVANPGGWGTQWASAVTTSIMSPMLNGSAGTACTGSYDYSAPYYYITPCYG
jgi:hypothetical protein